NYSRLARKKAMAQISIVGDGQRQIGLGTREHKDLGRAKPQVHQRSPSLRVEVTDPTLAKDVAERRGGGDQSGNCSRKETLPLPSLMEVQLPILWNCMHEGVRVEAGQGGGYNVVDREDGHGLMAIDLDGVVNLVKERTKLTNG
ncbi:hypothetical protein GW17_00055156, partial [Ensete ventricosum]